MRSWLEEKQILIGTIFIFAAAVAFSVAPIFV